MAVMTTTSLNNCKNVCKSVLEKKGKNMAVIVRKRNIQLCVSFYKYMRNKI